MKPNRSFSLPVPDSYLPSLPGDIITETGKVVGRHDGLWRYTVGERARISGLPEAVFVAKKDSKDNTVVVVPKQCV
jgi:tRNA U34 2-thiouridine synthase MnmA/TrmU